MLKVHVERLDLTAILHVHGHIVIGTEIESLRGSVHSQIDVSTVVLNLTHVSRIDARGLGLLLELREQLEVREIEFRLLNVNSRLQQIMKITCLDSVFWIGREEEIRSRDAEELVLEEAICL